MTSAEKRAAFLYALGVTVAICGAAKMPAEGAEWSDALPIFVAGAVVGVVGLVWWRRLRSQIAAAMPAQSAPDQDPFALLAGLIPDAKSLAAEVGTLQAPEIQVGVDRLLDTWVLPFAEVRQSVIDRLGMQKGAEILVTIAYGERMLNRVWSAAADGHLPEARACLPEAVDALQEAAQIAAKARETG